MNQKTDDVSLESTEDNTEENKTEENKVAAKKTVKKKVAIKKAVTQATSTKKATTKAAPVKKATTKKATTKSAPIKKSTAKKATTKAAPVKKATTKKATTKSAPAKKATTKKASSLKAEVVNPWGNNDWLNNATAFNFSTQTSVKKKNTKAKVEGISHVQEQKMPNENSTTKELKPAVYLKVAENRGIVNIFAQLGKTNTKSPEIAPVASQAIVSEEKKQLISNANKSEVVVEKSSIASNITQFKHNARAQSVVNKKNEKSTQATEQAVSQVDKPSFKEKTSSINQTGDSVLVAFLNKTPQSLLSHEKEEEIKAAKVNETLNLEQSKPIDVKEHIKAVETQQEKDMISESQSKEQADLAGNRENNTDKTNLTESLSINNKSETKVEPLFGSAISHLVLSSRAPAAKTNSYQEKSDISHVNQNDEPSAFQVAVEEINQNKVTTSNKPKVDLSAIRSELDNSALHKQATHTNKNELDSTTTTSSEEQAVNNTLNQQKKANIAKQSGNVEVEGLIEGVSIAVYNGVKHVFSIGKYASIGLAESVKDSKKIASLALEKVSRK